MYRNNEEKEKVNKIINLATTLESDPIMSIRIMSITLGVMMASADHLKKGVSKAEYLRDLVITTMDRTYDEKSNALTTKNNATN